MDHVRLSLMNQIRNGDTIHIGKLVSLTLVVGIFAWFYEIVTGGGDSQKTGLKDFAYEWRSYVQKKHSMTIEGKHVTGIDHYSRRPITLANTFSRNFRAILFHVVQNVESMPDIRELKEFATNIIRGEHYEGKGVEEEVKTLFTVSQKTPFLLDKSKEIYCTIRETGEQRETDAAKNESRMVKFNISVFSYKSNACVIKSYVNDLKDKYSKYLEEKRRGRLFVYTLNNVEVQNDDDDDTVGGWQETAHETMKSFDNIFFDGKQEVIKKINFFINNKDWYRRNGVPYTLGISLHGPPGTGKTSFIKALATLLNRHIVSMSLSRIKTKKQLQDFYYETQYSNVNDKNAVGFDKKIMVFEDIDCVGDIVMKRKPKPTEPSSGDGEDVDDFVMDATDEPDLREDPAGVQKQIKHEISKAAKYVTKQMMGDPKQSGPFAQDTLTLDDILNLWDGIRENTGRILIVTTNHYNKLDPALVRPGRIDIPIHLDNASRASVAEMYEHYYGEKMDENDLEVIPDKFYSPAEVINFYVSNHENPRGFIERLASCKKITSV